MTDDLTPDDRMHARLQGAGARWRDDHDRPADAGPSTGAVDAADAGVLGAPPARRRPRGLLASAAAVAAAVVVGGAVFVHGLGGGRQTAATAHPLRGTVWQVTSYGDTRPTAGNVTTFYLGPDGAAVFDDDCTVVGARADVDTTRHHLDFVDVSQRAKTCLDEYGTTLDKHGLDALLQLLDWKITGGTLTLRPLTGQGQITLHATTLPPPTLDLPTFVGSIWQLTAVTDSAGRRTRVNVAATLTVSDGRFVAEDTCNHLLKASIGVNGNKVAVRNATFKAKGCTSNRVESLTASSRVAPVVDAVLGADFSQDVAHTTLTVHGLAGSLDYAWQPRDPTAVAPTALVARAWVLQSVGLQAAAARATLRIEASGAYTAGDGCGGFNGTATVATGTLAVTVAPKTGGASSCTGRARSQAETIYSFLRNSASWAVRDGRLLIYGGGAQANVLIYCPASADTALRTLAGTAWSLSGIGAGTNTPTPPAAKGLQLRFGSRPPVVYDDGVNAHSGAVTLGSSTITFGQLGTTLVGCAPSTRCTQAALIGRVLDGTVSWSITGGRLRITKRGVGTVVYDRGTLTPDPAPSATPTR